MSKRPFFSVMVPTYNQAGYLDACLTSLIAQNEADWEAVAVDDGSTDDTPRVLEAWEFKDPRVRSIRQDNGGTAAALNAALANCRGDWVCWLSSDDLFEPDKLTIHRQAIAACPDIRFFHTHFYHLEEDTGMKTAPPHWRPVPEPGLQSARFFSGNYVSGITVCIERQALLAAAPFRTDLRHAQDFAMWLELSRRHPFHFSDRRTAVMRWHAGQTTNAFPVAGLYDSAWACLEFLMARPFAALFPFWDLDDPTQAEAAVTEALSICLDTAAFLHQLGYTPALLARLVEWVSDPAGGLGREKGRALLEAAVSLAADKPEPLREMFDALPDWPHASAVMLESPGDCVRRTIADPRTDERKRRNLIRYLDKINGAWRRA